MGNKFMDTALLDKAIIFAVKAHANTERRGKGFPYIVHPLEAVEIVATITPDQELLAAAALHDTVEDTDVTLEDIRREFGERVSSLVASESDTPVAGVSESDSWRSRKQAAIDRLAAASYDGKIVALGDKLSNMRAIARDYKELGDKLWDRFHAPGGRPDHAWHYRGLASSLSELADTHAYKEFSRLIDEVFAAVEPELINLDDYVRSGEGHNAQSFNHKDGKRMMKLNEPFMPFAEAFKEYTCAQAVTNMGLVTPRALRMVTDGKRVGVEFERISPKKSYSRSIADEPARLEEFARSFARAVRKLHSTPCNCNVFPSAVKHYLKVVDISGDFTPEEKEKLTAFIKAVPQETTCLHGDLHIGNLITDGVKDYWIDLADFRYGNPLFDLGMFYLACNCNPEWMTRDLFHISNAQIAEVWKYFVDEYYGGEKSLEEAEALISPYAALPLIFFANIGGMKPYMREPIDKLLLSKI